MRLLLELIGEAEDGKAEVQDPPDIAKDSVAPLSTASAMLQVEAYPPLLQESRLELAWLPRMFLDGNGDVLLGVLLRGMDQRTGLRLTLLHSEYARKAMRAVRGYDSF